jgi:Tol biopolymer transport system component
VKSLGSALGVAVLAGLLAVLTGCTQIIQNPTPTLSALSPDTIVAGGASFTLTVKGSKFVFGASILWNGNALRSVFDNDGEMHALIDPRVFPVPGSVAIQVVNPSPGGGYSNSLNLTINPVTSPVPSISQIQPAAALVGSTSFGVTVTGTNFVPTSVVTWNGQNLSTSYVSGTQVQASVPSTNVQSPGSAQVAVLNPQPGGGLSNSMTFLVNNPQPILDSISPTTSISSGADFTLTVNGIGFTCADIVTTTTTTNGVSTTTTSCNTSASQIQWNGTTLDTTYDLTNKVLTASVTSAQLAQAGTAFVTVMNPAPGGGTSAPAYFQVIPGANGEGLPALVDVSSKGAQADSGIGHLGSSGPAIAGGGRFIAYSSVSQNLVANLANAVANVFVRDTCLGISSGCTPQTLLASLANDSQPPNADCLQPSISSDGRFVTFASAATNLVSGVSGGNNEIYLRDTCLGADSSCTPSTRLVSLGADGATPADGTSSQPSISADGQFIAFVSTATNLVAAATTGAPEVYLRSTCLNGVSSCVPTTILASVAADGVTPADGTSSAPVVSSGGRYLAFNSTATNLVSTPSSGTQQLYWRDTCMGVASGCTPATQLVSIGSDGTSPGNGTSGQPSLSSDGRYVVFSSQATNLTTPGFVSGTPQQIYEGDMCAGASGCTPSISLVSVGSDGSSPANALAEHPSTDQSGRYVLFASTATNLASVQANGFEQVFGRDTCIGATGCTPRTVLISVASDGTTLGKGDSLYPAITTQAHFATFLSFANNIVNDDTEPSLEDIFLAITNF